MHLPGIAVVLGSTYTGEFEDVEAFDAMIGESCGRWKMSMARHSMTQHSAAWQRCGTSGVGLWRAR